jgi:serine/threonine protein kinase
VNVFLGDIVHRDLTLDNILIFDDNNNDNNNDNASDPNNICPRVVICDFGVAAHVDDANNLIRGNCRRYAPEALLTKQYTTAADVYMYGIAVVEQSCNGREVLINIAAHLV